MYLIFTITRTRTGSLYRQDSQGPERGQRKGAAESKQEDREGIWFKLKWRHFSLSDRGFTNILVRSDWMFKAGL